MLLRARKLMFNWVKIDKFNNNLKLFESTTEKCDKIQNKLIAIYTNKLFPEIMPDDIPNQN